MDKPTEAQKKKVLEWCGFSLRCPPEKDAYKRGIWNYPDGLIGDMELDLNNLFKYAVPLVIEKYGLTIVRLRLLASIFRAIKEDKDPALALFWAIWEVKHG